MMIRALAILLPLLSITGCAAAPMVPATVGYVTPYLGPLASDTVRERVITAPQDEVRDRELAELRDQVSALRGEVAQLRRPTQLTPPQPSLTVEDLRRLDTLARDRKANREAFGR